MPEADAHSAFKGAGSHPGVEIWRIKGTEPVKQDLILYGKFYSGDAYVVLSTKHEQGHGRYIYDIHFWLGKLCTAEEGLAAAVRSMELDEKLGGHPVQHREIQDHESKLFLSYFKKGVRYLEGALENALRKMDITKEVKRLYQVKGERSVRIEQVECKCGSLNQADTFVLEEGPHIWVWFGPKSTKNERLVGLELARNIRDEERDGDAMIHIVDDDWNSSSGFFNCLGSRDKVIKATDPYFNEDDLVRKSDQAVLLYKLSVKDNGKTDITEITTLPLKRSLLKDEECYVLDAGFSGVYLWTGNKCSPELKLNMWRAVSDFVVLRGYPAWVSVTRMVDGGEIPLFKQYFQWEEIKNEVKKEVKKKDHASNNISSNDVHEVEKALARESIATSYMPDKGDGKVEVFRIYNRRLVDVAKHAYGFFFTEENYIVLYTFKLDGQEHYIVYFWQGPSSSVEDNISAANHALEIEEKFKGKALQIRVLIGREPAHFLKIFKGKVVVLIGPTVRGFQNIKDYEGLRPNETVMYHIKGEEKDLTRAIQVEARANSLNSNDVFLIEAPERYFVWCGKYASDQEIKLCKDLYDMLAPKKGEPIIVKEDEDNKQFWNTIGGLEVYSKNKRIVETNILPPRLFHCSLVTGKFMAEEVVLFTQEDLDEDHIMVLDTFDEIVVWVGRHTSDVEKREAYKTAYIYLETDPTGRSPNNTVIVVIRQGYEPPAFLNYFEEWNPNFWDERISYKQLVEEIEKENAKIAIVEKALATVDRTYPIEVLQRRFPPEGIDVTKKEIYLSEEDFKDIFGMKQEQYTKLPEWKRMELKKMTGLF